MANLLSYAKNVGRSVVYTSIDVIESSNPTLKAFAEANQDLGKEAFAAIKDYKGTVQKARTSIKQNQYYKLIATAKKNIFEDLKSGNWYNKERENAVYDELTSYDDSDDWSFGDDIDFGDNDNSDEIELEVNESEVTRKTINTVGQAAANAVAKATVYSADYMATISIENTKMLMEDNKKHFAQVNLGLGAINSNISSIVRLGEPLTVHMQNSQKYYERTTTLLEENNKLLQQLVDLNTPSTSRNNKDNDQRKDFGYIAGYEGMIDIRKYGELVKRNIKNKSSILDSMINIDTGSGNFSDSLVASPISELMKLGLEGVTKKYVGDVMDNFNKSLEGVFGSLLMNMNTNSNKKGGIYKLINDIFGIPMSHGGDLNTANYEKGKVDFDGIARKSIVEVIPTYLAKILASVSGEPEIRYNYDTGRFITVHELKKQKDAYDRRFRDSATSQFRSQANQITSKIVMSKRDKDQFDKDLDKFLQYLYNNGENFQYNNHNISGYDVGGIDDNSLAIIRAIYRINEATGKGWVNTQMNKNILYQKSREYQQREYDQKKGDNANLNLLNGSIDYSLDPEGKKYTSVQHYKDMKAKLFTDEEGRDIFFYLKDYYEQIGAINSNIQFITNNGISDNINGLSSNIKIHSKSEKKNNKLTKFKNKKFTKGKNKKDPPIFPLPVIYNEETGEYEVNHDFQSLYYDEETGQYVNGYNKIDWSLYEENEDGVIVPKTKKKYKINKNNKLSSKNNSGRNINNSGGNNYSNNTINGVVNKRELPYFESEEKRRERERKEYDEQYHDSKMEKLEEQFWYMNMYDPEKGYDPEDLEERVFEFARFQNQVETSLKDSKKKKTIFEKLRDRKERSEGGAKLLEAADALAKGPVEFTTSILNTVNSTIYDMIFNEGDNEDEDGFLVTMKKRFNKTFDNFDETLDKLIDKMEGMWESGKDKINKFMKETLHLGFDLTDIKQGIFGEVDEETGIRSGGYLGDFIQNTKSSMGEIFDKITGVGNAAYGGKVKKTGVIAVSGGEYIIPAPGDKKEQLRKENEAKRRFFRSHGKSGWADLGNYADGGHVDGNINPDGTAEVEQATENDSKKRIEESKKKISESVSKQYVKAREAIRGHIDDTNTANAVDSIMEESGKNLPTLAAGGLLGAGFSLLTGLIGGPLLGAAVGAGGSLIMKSDKVKDILFGEIDEETGKRKKGMLPPGVTKFLTEKLPDMAKFGLGGGLASMVLPGGPIMGIMLGSAIGYAKNNEDFKNAIFGEGAIAEGLDTKLKKVLPKMGAGAALSALFSPLPGGIVSKLVLGAAVGFVSDSDKFKDLMFGTPTGKTDKNGKPIREGGIYGNLKKSFVDPLADFAKSYIHDSKIFFQENVFQPIKDLMDPIKNRAKRMKERAGNWIKKRAQKQMEKLKGSAGRIVSRRVAKVGAKISAAAAAKLAKLGITVEGGIIKTGINTVMAPIKGVGRRMRNKDTKQGYNDYEDINDQIERLNGMHGDQSNKIQALEYMKNLTNQQRIALGDQVEYLGSMHTTQDSYLNAAAKKHRRKIAGAADNMHIKIGDENAIRKILGDKKTFANEQNENRARRKLESILKKYDMTLDDAEGTFGNIVKTAFDDLGNKTRNIANTNKEETNFDDLLSKTFGIDSNKLSDKDKEYFRHMLISQSKYAKANPEDEEEPAQVTIQDSELVENRTSSLKDPLPTKVDIDHILESLNTIVAAVTIMTNKATGNEFDPNKYATTDISKAINEAKQKNQQFRESGTEQTEEEYNDVFDRYYDDENYEDIENFAKGGKVKRKGHIVVSEGETVVPNKNTLTDIKNILLNKFKSDAEEKEENQKNKPKTFKDIFCRMMGYSDIQLKPEAKESIEKMKNKIFGTSEEIDDVKSSLSNPDVSDINNEFTSKGNSLEDIRNILVNKFTQDDYITTSKGGIIRLHVDRSGEKVPDMRDKQTIDALKDIEDDSNTQKGILESLNGEDGILSKLSNLGGGKGDDDDKNKDKKDDDKEDGDHKSILDRIKDLLDDPSGTVKGVAGGILEKAKGLAGIALTGLGLSLPALGVAAAAGKLDGAAEWLGDHVPALKGNDTKSPFTDTTQLVVDGQELLLDDNGNPVESDDGGWLTITGDVVYDKNVDIRGTNNSLQSRTIRNIIESTAKGQKNVLHALNNGKNALLKLTKPGRKVKAIEQNITSHIANGKTAHKIKDAVSNVKTWASDPAAYREARSAVDTAQEKGKIAKFLDKAMECLGKAIKKVGSKIPGMRKIAPHINDIIKGLRTHIDDAIKTISRKTPDVLKKLGGGLKKLNAVMLVLDIAGGIMNSWGEAESILGIVDEATIGQRIIASIIGGINAGIPFIGNLIPNKTLVNIFMSIFTHIPLLRNLVAGLDEQRQKANETVSAYNDEHDTEYSIEDYNKIVQGKEGVLTGAWNDIKAFFRNSKENGVASAAEHYGESRYEKRPFDLGAQIYMHNRYKNGEISKEEYDLYKKYSFSFDFKGTEYKKELEELKNKKEKNIGITNNTVDAIKNATNKALGKDVFSTDTEKSVKANETNIDKFSASLEKLAGLGIETGGEVKDIINSKLTLDEDDPLSGVTQSAYDISKLYQSSLIVFDKMSLNINDFVDKYVKSANGKIEYNSQLIEDLNKQVKGVKYAGSGSRFTGYRGGSSIMTPLSQRNQVGNIGSTIKSPVSMPGVNGGPNNFVSQVNPVLKNLPFTQNTTIEENGCAPAVATMAINEFRPKFMSMNKATQYASEGNYATDDGTDASYFKDILGNSGINTEYIENDDNKNSKAIRDTLMNQGNMILLGQDNRNKSKTNSPFGTGQHYVLARGFDKSGRVIVKDPESNKERTYDSDILNHVQLGIATHDRLGSGSNLKKKKKPSLFGYRGGSRDNSGNVQDTEYAQRTWSYLTSNGYTPEVAAAIMGNMEQESYVNPETHQNGGPAAGIVQWQHGRLDGLKSYAASKNFTWTQLEPQLDYMDAEITGNTDKIGAAVDTTAVGYFRDAYGSPELYKQGTDVDKATYEFMKYFERCHEEDANMEGRYKWAGQYYEMYSGSPYTATYSSENPGGATALDKMTQTNNAGRSLGTLATAAAGGIGGVVGSLAGMIGKALASMYGIKNMSLVDSIFGTSFSGGMMSGESSGGVYGSSGYSSSGVTSTGGQATVQGDGSGIVAAARSKIGQLQYSQSRRNEIFSGGPGADCSSFVQWAVKQGAGVDPGSNSDAIYNAQNGTDVSVGAFNESELMPGDVMLWRRSGGNTDGVGHADIYAGDHKKINNGGPNEGDIGAVEKTIGDTSTFLKAKRFFVPGQVIEGKLGNVTNPITGSLGYNTTDGYTQNMYAREQSVHPTHNTTDGYTQNSNARVSNTIKGDIGHVTTDGYTQNMNANANKANSVSQATQALTNIANSVSDINQTNVPSQNAQNPMNNGVNGKKGSGSKRSKLYLGGGSGLSTSSSLEQPITRRAIRASTPQHSASGSGLLKTSSSNKPKSSSKSYATSSTDRSVLETLQHKSKNNISSVVDVLVDILKEIKEVKTNTDNNQKILDLLTEFFKKQMESKFDNATAVDNDSIAELMANLAMMASS